jgi:putative transcriptional regulator
MLAMDEELFAKLVKSVEWMERHRKGKARGGRITVMTSLDVKAARKKTGLSQAEFARILQVSKGTLLNWEQGRRAPTGPARALLKAVATDPEHVLKALNAA